MFQPRPRTTRHRSTRRVARWLCVGLWLAAGSAPAQTLTLRVGVYDNPPKYQAGESGEPSGILGDLLQEMARQERWQLEPVPCTWSQCLDWLASGHIDLMPDVALTQERSQRFSFHQTPALLSWSQIYEAPNVGLTSLLDLAGKRIAVLSGSVQQEYLQHLADSFHLTVRWIEVATIEEGFDAVIRQRADAVATNHFLGDQMAHSTGLNPSPILFQPSKLYYATALGKLASVRNAIDRHLSTWQANPKSPYFDILRRWGIEQDKRRIPTAVWWIMAALAAALILAMALGQWLRRQVSARTRSLRAVEHRLNTILDSVEARIFIKDRDLRYQYANQNVCRSIGQPLDNIIGQQDTAFFDDDSCAAIRRNDLRVIEQGERVAEEEHVSVQGSHEQRIYLSVKLPLRDDDGNIYALCGISTDITDYRRIQDQLHQLAFFDPLTDLPNRRKVLDYLRQVLSVSGEREGALLLIDLNNFKSLNDTLGHEVGDQLLQQVAQRLEHHVHNHGMAGRLGGDEFVLVLHDLDADPRNAALHVHHVALRLLAQLAEPFTLGDVQHITSCSIGIAMFSDARGSADTLMKNADLALTDAKTADRNTLRFFNPSMQTEMIRRSRIESALRQALVHGNELQVYVQPQFDGARQCVGMEALLRWHNPSLGWISPADFIPIAESSGLIVELGHWVLRQACATLARWQHLPHLASLTLAVNISPRQFRHSEFVNQVENCLHEFRIEPSRLELEITESLLIDNVEQTILRMNHLRSHGIRFSMDDFGTGYASLGYLKRLPLYQLKIDQSFVRDLMDDNNDEAIVRTIIALGHSLDLQVIAEGVETAAQLERLQRLGCHHFQGYFFGKPAAIGEWEARIGGERTD